MKNKIVVIGSSNVDLIMKMDHLPQKGETVTGGKFMQVYGGKGANQAVAAARAGGNVVFVSCVGEDAYTPQMVKNYRNDGIDTRFVFQEKGVASGYALIMIDNFGENIISVAPEANQLLTSEKIELANSVFDEAAIIVMQFEILEETVKYVIDTANKKGIPVMWNVAPAKKFDFSYISKTNILVLNEIETHFLSGIAVNDKKDAEKAAKTLIAKGVEKVIVTLGKKGAVAVSEEETEIVPAFKVNAIDTTAAGDTFCGTFAVALTEGKSLKDSLFFASAASAISVTKMGAQPSAPTREEIETFMKKHSEEY